MTKVISISDDAYDGLHRIKTKEESFTKVILRLTSQEKSKSLTDFFGAWPGNKSELSKIKKELERGRKAFKSREVCFN